MLTKKSKSIKMAGGSVRGSMDHLIGALAFQEGGANPNNVVYVPYDAGGKALADFIRRNSNSFNWFRRSYGC